MRLLKVNNEQFDIDDNTAIGIDFQAYDIKEPGSRKVAASNNFTAPLTANNLRIINFAGNPQSISKDIYSAMSCNYWNDNKRIIKNGTAKITSVAERISIFAFEKATAWTQMQDYYWPEFQQDFIAWLQSAKGLPSAENPFTGTFASFINSYISGNKGVVIPFLIANLSLYDPDGGEAYIENTGSLYLKYHREISGDTIRGLGSHFCVFCKAIFEFIEDKYEIDLSTDGAADYNIFDDAIVSKMVIPLRNLSIQHTETGFYFLYDNESSFLPETTTDDKENKTLYDFTKSFFQHFNAIIDNIESLDGSIQYIIRRFDDIDNAPIINLSGKIDGKPEFIPFIENYNQNNWIKFANIYEGGDELTNSKKIICKNLNLDQGNSDDSLFTIDAYIPSGIVAGGNTILNISPSDTLSNFTFFILSGIASTTLKSMQDGIEVSAAANLQIAQLYSLDDEYNMIASMVEYPAFYKIKRRLSLTEINNLVFFAKYYIKELNGYFFLNKIESYNPEKSTEATKLELIKIP